MSDVPADAGAIPVARRTGTAGYLRVLVVAVVVVPLLLFGGAGWINYRNAFEEARVELTRDDDAIAQHAQRVFETGELILDQVADYTAEMDWPEIARSPGLHELLKKLGRKPQVAMVGLIRPDGMIVASNLAFPALPATMDERSYFPVERPGTAPVYVGTAAHPPGATEPQFLLARGKPNSEQTEKGGLIFVAMRLSTFTDYYRTLLESGSELASMTRADGAVLVRYPDMGPIGRVLGPESGFRQNIAKNPQAGIFETASVFDHKKRLVGYRKVGNYPVYVEIAVTRASIVEGWLRLMASHLIFGLPATLCLIALTLVAWRRSEAADRAVAAAHAEAEARKAAEESLRHAQRMEAVGRMTGGVAHDFNNLLTAVTGNLDMILRRTDDEARVRRLAEAALRATTRGERLTQQLLMFSRRQVMRPETLNLNRLLLEFDPLMRRAAGERVELRLKLDAALDPTRIDRAQFEAAILNLVVNARDAIADGGEITIETRNATLDKPRFRDNPDLLPGSYIVTEVRDNGCGIPAADLSRIFEPFFTTKDVGKGSGLGLSQVYGFARESGGHVEVSSQPGRGTSVTLYLPRSADRPSEAIRRDLLPLRSTSSGETILVVEDDPAVLAMATQSLDDLGYTVLIAHNGQEALDILNSDEPVDVLFSDVVMPGGLNGAQLAVEARRLRPSIKVLLTSGYTGSALASEHGLPEELPVLGKPYRREQLAAQLRVILNRQLH